MGGNTIKVGGAVSCGIFNANTTSTSSISHSGTGKIELTGTSSISKSVTAIKLSANGAGYATAPTVNVGTPWAASTSFNTGDQIFYGAINGGTNGGNLYTVVTGGTTGSVAPSTKVGGDIYDGTTILRWVGFAAKANCAINVGNSISSITVTFPGSGYTNPPAINFTGGGGSGATATSTVNPNTYFLFQSGNVQLDASVNYGLSFSGTTTINGLLSLMNGSVLNFNNRALTLGATASATLAPNAVFNNLVTTNFGGRPVTLQSDATGTASIGLITGTLSGASNVTVQRFIPALGRKRYTLVSSPVNSTIYAGWQEGGVNTFAGFGTQITGGALGGTAAGFDLPVTSSTSIYTYNDAAAPGTKWTALTSTNSSFVSFLAPGTGYLLFVRGDRIEDRPSTGNSSNTVLRATGAVGQGAISPTLLTGAGKYTLIANPYPCAIDWNTIAKPGTTGSFTVYDSNLGIFVSSDGGTLTPSTGVLNGTQQPQYIQSGQAFFVQNSSAGNGTISFTEAAKTTVATTTIGTTVFGESDKKEFQQLNINAYRTANNQFADGAVALFGKGYSAAVDNGDINKFTNFNETFGLSRDGNVLGLEARPLFFGNDTLHFNLANFGKRDYSFVIDGNNFANTTAMLEDKYTATKQAIDLAGATTYNFTVNADAGSNSNDRFIITLGSTATIVATDVTTNNSLFVKMSPNPVSNQLQVSFKTEKAEQATIKIINSLGQVVKTVNAGRTDNGNISISVTSLSTGVYTVQLLSGDKQISSQKLVKE